MIRLLSVFVYFDIDFRLITREKQINDLPVSLYEEVNQGLHDQEMSDGTGFSEIITRV